MAATLRLIRLAKRSSGRVLGLCVCLETMEETRRGAASKSLESFLFSYTARYSYKQRSSHGGLCSAWERGSHACPEPPRVWLLCVPSPSIRWGSTVQGHSAPTLLGLFTGAEEGESVMGAACGVCPACKSLQPNTAAPRSSMSASPPPGSRHPSHQLMEGTLRPQCSIFT